VEARWLEALIEALDGERDGEAGAGLIAEVAVEAQAIGYEELCVTAYRDASAIAARRMDYRRARAWLAEGLRYADTYEQSHCGHVMRSVDAIVAWAEGRWIDAIAAGEQAIADGGCGRGTVMARTALGYVLLGRGIFERAREHLDEGRRIAERSEELDLLLPVTWGQAELAVVAGDAPAAVRWCEAAFERASAVNERTLLAPFTVTGARAYQACGRPDEAERWLERMAGRLADSSVAVAGLDHAAGLVRLASGSTGAARDALERAIEGWQDRGRTWETAWARLDLASALLRASRHAEALAVLGTARATAAGLDSEPLLARADELMRVARGRGATEEPWRPLTVREYEVARLIGEGLTNAGIAHELDISPRTASAHVEHILAKLGATRRTEIATWVAAIGGRFDGAVAAPPRERPIEPAAVAARSGSNGRNGR
jgi:DNA-binding CsgD family transcriptional regulator